MSRIFSHFNTSGAGDRDIVSRWSGISQWGIHKYYPLVVHHHGGVFRPHSDRQIMCFSSGSGSDVSNISQRQRILCVILNTNIPHSHTTENGSDQNVLEYFTYSRQKCMKSNYCNQTCTGTHFNVYFPLAPSQPLQSGWTITSFSLRFAVSCYLLLVLMVLICLL